MTAPYYPNDNPSAAGSFLEGVTGGFQAGHGFRAQRDDRKRALVKDDENTAYERARRLREAVGFELTQKVQNAQLARAERDQAEYVRQQAEIAARQQRVRESATVIRQRYSDDPRYKEIALLPDEELIEQFGGLATHPERFERPDAPETPTQRNQRTRADLGQLNAQVDDARSEVARAERDAPTRPPLADFDPGVAARFTTDSTAAASRIGDLRRYMGNLLVQRDSTAAVSRGQRFDQSQGDILRRLYGVPASPAGRPATNPADRWEELVKQGVKPDEATRMVRQQFRLP